MLMGVEACVQVSTCAHVAFLMCMCESIYTCVFTVPALQWWFPFPIGHESWSSGLSPCSVQTFLPASDLSCPGSSLGPELQGAHPVRCLFQLSLCSALSPHPCLIPVSHGSLDSRVPCFGLPTVQLSSPTSAPAPGRTGTLVGPRSEGLDRAGGGHRQSLICQSGSPRPPQCSVLRLGDERDYMGPGQTVPNCPNSQVMSQCSAKSYRREMGPRGIGTFCLTHTLQVTPITPGCGLDPVPPKQGGEGPGIAQAVCDTVCPSGRTGEPGQCPVVHPGSSPGPGRPVQGGSSLPGSRRPSTWLQGLREEAERAGEGQ